MRQHLHKRDQQTMSSKTFARIAKTFSLPEKRVLDIGCGYGEYMQRFGKMSVGITSRAIEVEYGKIIGRDIRSGNAETLATTLSTSEQFDVIWCNNIFEHLLSPHAFLVHLKEFARKDSLLILGTPILPTPSLLTKIPKFRGALAVEHINFFTKKTYELTAIYAGWDVVTIRPYYFENAVLDHLITPAMPHLYLVAKNNADFRYPERKKSEWVEDPYYADLLRIQG